MSKLKMMAIVMATTALFLGGKHVLAQDRPAPGGPQHDKFDAMDTNKDGKISYEEYMAYHQFDAMDTNKDGKISYEEYMAYHQKLSEEKFKALDADSNGFVTREEYQKARELKGKKRRKGMSEGSSN